MQKRPMRPMSEEEVHAAALSDPDAQPLTEEDFKRMKRVPRVKTLRGALGLTQEEFAQRYHIPLGDIARLGAGALRTGSAGQGVSEGHRARSRRGFAPVAAVSE